jgi:hypothetical protein
MAQRGRPKFPKDLAEAMREIRKLRAEVANAEAAARQHDKRIRMPKSKSSSSSRERDPDEDQIA